MPHQRPRLIAQILKKRLKLWPVVGLVGVRQSGKSTLLRDIIGPALKARYLTLDSLTYRQRAQTAPEGFTESQSPKELLIIDEIQKAPDLFDAIKLHVDNHRRPGAYLVSGSTEFSSFTGIRESLTGRIGILNLYPLTLAEMHEKNLGEFIIKPKIFRAQIHLTQFEQRLQRGGMPGMAFLRSPEEFHAACETWIETTCYRDLGQIQGRPLEGALAVDILRNLVLLEDPVAFEVAKRVRKDTRVVQRYLDAFERILVLKKLRPHPAGIGKDHYVLCDVGLASHLGASREVQLRTHMIQEALALTEASGWPHPHLYHYRNEGSSRIPIILDWGRASSAPKPLALRAVDAEVPQRADLDSLLAFRKRAKISKMRTLLLAQTTESYKEGDIEIHPLRG